MSRKATMEYVGVKRRAYLALDDKAAKTAALDEFCAVTGMDRKYAIKLLTGKRIYREHRGRGKTYTSMAEDLFVRVWHTSGYMTPQYLKTVIARQLTALGELEHVDGALAEQVLRMSASTMERILRLMSDKKASDVYLSAHSPALIKINGLCIPINNQVLPPDAPRALLAEAWRA